VGVWGSGLYSGDFAADLRAAVGAVSRLPFDGDKLAEILSGIEPGAANNPGDQDHSTFWLILADQFRKRGIYSKVAREKALEIIDTGADLAMLGKLGMKPADLKKRQTMLMDLRSQLAEPIAKKRGPVLKKPQPLVMQTGDVLIYPTSKGHCINSYFPSKERMVPKWSPDGWSATIIVETGRAFDFLAWYRPMTVETGFSAKPSIHDILSACPWVLRSPGTCSPTHFKRLELEKIHVLEVDASKLKALFPGLRSGTSKAINDVSIANELNVREKAAQSSMQKSGRLVAMSISNLREMLA